MRLLEPYRIGQMELRNRIVMPPMVTRYGNKEGNVTERTKNYYEARARGGAALLIVEATYIHARGRTFVNQLGISDDKFIIGMSQLVRAIHKHNAKTALQLHHGGGRVSSQLILTQPVASSPIPVMEGEIPKELTTDEIAEIVLSFSKAALRAKKAGFDGVEIHGAHGFLIDQFLSRSTNKRQDGYGGDLQGRTRFLIEVIKAVRKAVGTAYPMWCRINGKQYGVEQGTSIEEAQEIARMAQDAGADAIHVTAFGPEVPINLTTPVFSPAVIIDLAEGIKKVVTVPVIAVGRITPEAGEKILAEGKADLISIGKGLLADPELPNRVASGRLEDITPCTVCFGCRDDVFSSEGIGIRCQVNAALGREGEFKIAPSKKPKKVLIVGGGPGGMETARVAALRRHQVTLWERENRLGGQLVQAAIPPHKGRIEAFSMYLRIQLEKLGVKIELGKEATADMIKEFAPEAVVLATGAKPRPLEIPGLDCALVVQAGDVLEGKVEVGNRVVVIGGERIGCETAEFLSEKGKKVTVMRRGPEMALKVAPSLRSYFLDRLLEKGITFVTGVNSVEASYGGLLVTTKEKGRMFIEADTIVLAVGSIPNRKLHEEIKGVLSKIYLVGDCVEPRTIRDAVAEGYGTGFEI